MRIVWGYRWWLLLLCLVAGAAAYTLSDRAEPTYRATALLQLVSGRQAAGEFVGQQELLQLANVTAELARTQTVAERAADRLSQVSSGVVSQAVDVSARGQVQIIEVAATTGSPDLAADIANAYADAVVERLAEQNAAQRDIGTSQIQERVREIERELALVSAESPTAVALNAELQALQSRAADIQARLGDSVTSLQPATPPSEPVSPKPIRDAVLAVTLAFIVGAGLAYVRSRLSDRYDSAEELAHDLELPLLGEIPHRADDVLTMESIRALRTNVTFAFRGHDHTTLVLTSAGPGAGKSHLSLLLARSFVDDGQRLALVDADLRKPVLHERLPVDRQPGIGDLITSERTGPPELTTQQVPLSRMGAARGGDLDVVSAGRHVADPAEALGSVRMRQALDTLRHAYDVVLLDTPPVLAVVDAVILSRTADGVLLIVDVTKERRSDVRRAAQTLRAVEAPLVGVIANGSTATSRYGYYAPPADDRVARVAERP